MESSNRLQQLEEIPYPPPPWKMKGQLWMGYFKSDAPVQLPTGLHHLFDPRSLIVTIVRYQEGTLQYDELVLGTLVRLGGRVGIYVDYIWVTSLASVWGGRRIWGLPKNMAEFSWQDSTVRVTDDQGLIATIRVDAAPAGLPWSWLPIPMPGVGQLENNQWVFTIGQLWGRFGRAGMHIEEWAPARFGYHPSHQPAFGFAAKPFRMQVPAAKIL